MGVVNVKELAERAASSQRAKVRELEELLAIRDQLEREIEGGFRHGFRTIDQISAGWHEFYRIEGRIEESELIICATSPRALKLLSTTGANPRHFSVVSGTREGSGRGQM